MINQLLFFPGHKKKVKCLPRGKIPGSIKVAMLKFARTNRNTSPLYTGMAGEISFVSQGHLWKSKGFWVNTQKNFADR